MNAIILAGGKGSRLAPWTAPKSILPINGVTMMQRLLKHLLRRSRLYVDRAVVCTGYRAKDIETSVREHGWSEEEVVFSCAGEDAPMGARLQLARDSTDRGRVLVCYADELANVDLDRLMRAHTGRAITFAASGEGRVSGGVVRQDRGPVRIDECHRVLVNIGFVVAEPECWEYLQPEDGVSDWINRASGAGLSVGIHHHVGARATVNSLADLQYAEEIWR